MFFPEQHIGGLWDISEHEKDTTIIDKKKRKALTPTDMTPIYKYDKDTVWDYTNITGKVVRIEGTKCDMRKSLCRAMDSRSYKNGICEHHTVVFNYLNREAYAWDKTYTHRQQWMSYSYGRFFDKAYKNKLDIQYALDYTNYNVYARLSIAPPDTIITLDMLRNASAYLDLQKELPKIRKYDGFTELDYDSVYSLLKHIHLQQKYWWYDDKLIDIANMTDTGKLVILSKVLMALHKNTDEAIIELYYELVNSIYVPNVVRQVLIELHAALRDSSNAEYKVPLIQADGTIVKVTSAEFLLMQMPTVTPEGLRDIKEKIDILIHCINQACHAYQYMQEGIHKYGKITNARYKKAARILAQGMNYAKRNVSSTARMSNMTSFSNMLKYIDEDTANFLADKNSELGKLKADHEFRTFNAKYVKGSKYNNALVSGGKPIKATRSGREYYWGDMAIINEPLTQNLKHRLRGATHKPNEYGVIPHYTDRYFSDKRLFRVKKNIKGGTVLIDASGSMSLTEDEIFKILEELPASTVAMYSGTSGYGGMKARGGGDGELCIIAKNQRMVSTLPESLLENVIDYPALLWLSRMPKPRIWVSDEEVTMLTKSSRGSLSEANAISEGKEQCMRVKKQAGIITLSDIEAVVDFAKSMKRH